MKNNLWILTEENPKNEVIMLIIKKFAHDNRFPYILDKLRLLPVLKDNEFTFTYEVLGIHCNKIEKIYIKSISGFSSMVDFLLFFQKSEPIETDIPIYAIEETKTDDSESRNTGTYQRIAKFIYVDFFYPNVRKIMLYNLQVIEKESPTDTYIFGTRLLLTLGVEILGKKQGVISFMPFKDIDELIDSKNLMRMAPKGNVSIRIRKVGNKIMISGRLEKANSISHDPNIGGLSAISSALRIIGWEGEIEIVEHGLKKRHMRGRNKFIQIATQLGISLKNLNIPLAKLKGKYWKYEISSEKLATIFLHITIENFTHGFSIFENHAGCEKGYFVTSVGEHIPLEKYDNRDRYKGGDKTQIINIPDLIICDECRCEIINIEGKIYSSRAKGIQELNNYDPIELKYISKYYPGYGILRTVVIYGSTEECILEIEIGFLLNDNGKLVLGKNAPKIFEEAIKNLQDFWKE